jgi:hypothetical protein
MPKAKGGGITGIRIDEGLPEAYIALGHVKYALD